MSSRNNEPVFDNFSESAQKVLISAQKIAREVGENIGPEHILLALSTIRGTISYDLLREHLISPDQIRLIIGSHPASKSQDISLSKDGKLVLKRAVLTAANFGHMSIDSEHLLMACISDPNILSYQIILQLGADPEKIKMQLINLFNDLAEMDNIIQKKLNSSQVATQNLLDENESNLADKKSKNPALEYFTADLTKQAENNTLDPVIGREKEISRALQILSRRSKNNPIFIGEPGVGKTAIVEGIAQLIATDEVPVKLQNKKILHLDLPLLVAGTVYRGQFEERIKKLLDEVSRDDNIILFIDEIHTIVGAGSAEGSIDAANILKPALVRNKIRIIGATTLDEYRKYIEKDSALERRLQPIMVDEPTTEESIAMLYGLKKNYESYHNVNISEDAIRACVELSNRYISDRFLPDKAIDVLDEAAALSTLKRKNSQDSKKIKNLQLKLHNINNEKLKAVNKENFKIASMMQSEAKLVENQIEKLSKRKSKSPKRIDITRENIAQIISQITGIPTSDLMKQEKENLIKLEERLKKYIIAQDEAIKEVSNAIKRNRTGIGDENKPIASFIFLGPTGVGKTELAKVLAREVYGSLKSLIKIDMSEFAQSHTTSKLVGAPPGYVGYDDAGKLTEKVRRNPYSVILFDEIDKAHSEVFNILLQVLDEGYLTDSQGRKVNFRHSMIILTSNAGLKEYYQNNSIGFTVNNKYEECDKINRKLMKSLKNQFRPEFLGRIDKVIVFKPLNKDALKKIVDIEIEKLKERVLKNEEINLNIDESVKKWLLKVGTDKKYGARPLKRAIQNFIENIVADKILIGTNTRKSTIYIRIKDNRPMISTKPNNIKLKIKEIQTTLIK